MIDPRKTPVAMLPALNAIAGHMIAAAAPLRVINVEDTEQMVREACEAGNFDEEALELELAMCVFQSTWFDDGMVVARDHAGMNLSDDAHCLLNSLECVIAESV